MPEYSEDCRLSAHALTVGYGRTPVLHAVHLEVAPGQMTVLLGPNGSGKSTLLATLARLQAPLSGQVLLDGRAIHERPTREVARQLGLLPQQAPVPEEIDVAELVGRGRFPHRRRFSGPSAGDEAAVSRALALTGLADLAREPVESLSGGQRQRAWIAMVLAQETGLILLDEPTTYLDLHHQVELLSLLRRLVREEGRTIVCVLHDLNLALQYADRLVLMKGGAIRHRLDSPAACSAAMVEEVFATPVLALSHPETGLPVFLPRRGAAA